MNFSFNLVDQPWIPCTDKNGRRIELGLRDVLVMAHELSEIIGDNPITTAALYRIALAILYRVFSPKVRQNWSELWQGKKWEVDKLDEYFSHWRGRFDLFDPEFPIFQDPSNIRKPKNVASLIQGVAAGADATLFCHRTETSDYFLTPAEAARALVATQTFGLAGTAGAGLAFSDASCCRAAIFLVEGENLFETLALNLTRYPLPDNRFNHSPKDCPSWEMDAPNTNAPERPYGYLDYLTWHNRSVKLVAEEYDGAVVVRDMVYGPGLRLPGTLFNPMVQFFANKKEGFRPLRFSEEKSLWRDSIALFEVNKVGEKKNKPPYALEWLGSLVSEDILPHHKAFHLMALGMATEPGKDKVYFMRQERLPLPLEYLTNPELVTRLEKVILYAENTGKVLWGALKHLAVMYLEPFSDPSDPKQRKPKEIPDLIEHWGAERSFWSSLEQPFFRVIVDLPEASDRALEVWKKDVNRAAYAAFNLAENALGNDTRAWKAIVGARSQLNFGLSKLNAG